MEKTIDRLPLSQLQSRYNIARSAVYSRLKDLNISQELEGKRAYVNSEQLKLLDALHEHLQKGGTTRGFLDGHSLGLSRTVQDSTGRDTQTRMDNGSSSTDYTPIAQGAPAEAIAPNPLSNAIAHILDTLRNEAQALTPQTGLMLDAIAYYLTTAADQFVVGGEQDPFATHRWLELAAKKGWLLPTSKLLPLLGLKSIPKLSDRKFARLGFLFERMPRSSENDKIPTTGGIEAEWKVSLLKDKKGEIQSGN